MPLVSAVIPTYNRADHVGGAIDSVLAQTHDDIEAVVVNDGSEDDTRATLAEYADDDRVRVLHNDENRGIAHTFNRAVEAAAGEFVGILGDDDRWRPPKIERQLARFDDLDDDYCCVYTGGVRIDSSGRVVTRIDPHAEGTVYPDVFLEFDLLPHSSHLVRRDALLEVGGFDPEFPHAVDWDVNIRLAREYKFAYVDERLVERHFHDDNVSGDVVAGDPAYQVDAHERVWRKFREDLREFPDVERAFAATAEKHRGRAAIAEGDRRRAVAHLLAASTLDPSVEHVGTLATGGIHPRLYQVAQRGRARLREVVA
jgi:glycosyltransferase involved in cell wall biosynthesis